MDLQLKKTWISIRSSLWFIPSLMIIGASVAAYGLVALDHKAEHEEWHVNWFLYGGNPEGARQVLSTIASSMMTIAGIIFSMTLVALTMASAQFGPRLLRNFIRDRGNQWVLGTFIATFIYALAVLLATRGGEEDSQFVPKLAITFAYVFVFASLGVLIYFIHHVATSIQADNVLRKSYTEFQNTLKNYMLTDDEKINEITFSEAVEQAQKQQHDCTEVPCTSSGYVQLIDYEKMCEWAAESNLVVQVMFQPGDFIMEHQRLVKIYSPDKLPQYTAKIVNDYFAIAAHGTSEQDIQFSLKQIVEVGVRALSPSLNDPHTAINASNWLGDALMQLARKNFPPDVVRDKGGVIRVIKKTSDYKSIVHTCFDQLRLYAKENIFVSVHLMGVIRKVLKETNIKDYKSALQNMAEIIVNDIHKNVTNKRELAEVDQEYRQIMEIYNQ